MQDTLGEHRRSAAPNTPSQDCPMPSAPSRAAPGSAASGKSHRSHAFRVQGDRSMLARAVNVKAAELRKGEVRLEIAPGTIGHSFPTGDLYRQVEIRAVPMDSEGRDVMPAASEILKRSFGPERAGQSIESTLENREIASRLIERAPEKLRAVAWLHYVDGMDQEEVARVMGITRRTVFNRIEAFRATADKLRGRAAV